MLFLLSDGSVSSIGQQNASMKHETPAEMGPCCLQLATNAQDDNGKLRLLPASDKGFIKVSPTTKNRSRRRNEMSGNTCLRHGTNITLNGPKQIWQVNLPYCVKPTFTDGHHAVLKKLNLMQKNKASSNQNQTFFKTQQLGNMAAAFMVVNTLMKPFPPSNIISFPNRVRVRGETSVWTLYTTAQCYRLISSHLRNQVS